MFKAVFSRYLHKFSFALLAQRSILLLTIVLMTACALHKPPTWPFEETKSFSVLLVYANGINKEAGYAAFKYARDNTKELLNIRLHLAGELSYSRKLNEESPALLVRHWKKDLVQHTPINYDIVIVLFNKESLTEHFQLDIWGYSENIGMAMQTANAMAFASISGNQLVDGRVIMHEVGHLLGAKHSSTGIMNAHSMLLQLATEFSAESRAQIKAQLESPVDYLPIRCESFVSNASINSDPRFRSYSGR